MSPSKRAAPRDRPVPSLSPGELVGIVAPGFAVEAEPLRAGIAQIEAMGYRVRLGRSVLSRRGYLAGTDAERLADLRAMIGDPEVRAVWFARGGYGTARLLDEIPWSALRRDPKLLIGYSDLTALFNAAQERSGIGGLYGPVVTELGEARTHQRSSLIRALAGEPYELSFPARNVLVPGRASGRLIGGNLTVLAHLCGTRFAPRPEGAILFLEEIGEETYRIDRALTQLRQSGRLDGLSGVLVGSLCVPSRRRFPPDRRVPEVLREFFASLGVPVVRGLPVGHLNAKRTIPIGELAAVDTVRRRIRFPRRRPATSRRSKSSR